MEKTNSKNRSLRVLLYGALCIALSFALSYVKLFSMPMGGSITLCSMLPLCLYACAFGPKYGFLAAFAYGVLQVIQGAYIVHPAQFVLDYFLAFTALGLASFFPKKYALGTAVGGGARMLCSIVSGAVFFGSYAAEAGWNNAWLYSVVYNLTSIGVDTALCVIVALLPPVKKLINRLAV
ncbi:MAG: energy-coupled thiamine transporter ThiT [Clostridia bacterium]|nr:energy-coupled thiamine transporter ThiT [Clostridia bacterium]